jgi:phosphoribosylamine--glycine ligase
MLGEQGMNILLIGSGGREHALAWALKSSPLLTRLFCAPGNAAMAELGQCVALDAADHERIIDFCRVAEIGFVVIGPEDPLVGGLADKLRAAGIKTFGPSRAAAQLEGSKSFTKTLCAAHGIPTAAFARFTSRDEALAYIRDKGAPIVIKADGLAAGKGVIIAETPAQAADGVNACFDGAFGAAGAEVVIEEWLQGEEASFFALCDGEDVVPLASAQDHKRAFDGDKGPNTGGMGAYSPAPVMTPEMTRRTMNEIILPTVMAMRARGMPFQGVLYAGLMITAEGPKLIEYNVRFGDPECQVLMVRLKSDLLAALLATADGTLGGISLEWRDEAAVTICMATKGYPGAYEKGSEIKGLEDAAADENVVIFHAGTRREGERILASGGRILNVTALGATIAEARARAYAAINKIDWPGGFYRSDIGWRAIEREVRDG